MNKEIWKFEGKNKVIHVSGLAILVLEGSFSDPYRIEVTGGEALGPIERAAFTREGMSFGADKEIKIEVTYSQREYDASYDPHPKGPRIKPPSITYKPKRKLAVAESN